MSLKKLKIFFTNNLLIITVILPLIIILFYGISLSFILKYKHEVYTKQELRRYEYELKNKHKNFLREKANYIESFMDFVYSRETNTTSLSLEGILKFVDSIKRYDSGFIFIFHKNGTVIKHPCTQTLVNLVHNNNQKSIVSKLMEASNNHEFVYYNGTNCIDDNYIRKIAFVHHIRTTDFYIVISKNEKDILHSIEEKKRVLRDKLNDESNENIKLLFIVSLISILVSILFSKIINILIKDYERQIKESNRVMFSQSRLAQAGELLSMISHQWRQPISKIASISTNMRFKLMMGKELKSEHIDKQLEEIEGHTEFLSEIIDDFREFYKPKKNRVPIYILPLIDRSLDFLDGKIKKKNIVFKKEFAKDVKVSIYSNEFIQVVINIIQNAIEFSKNGATIEIKTQIKDDEYTIMIKDQAGGISEENIGKIFDAHFSTKTSKESTNLGLGLYLSKVIIEKHFSGKLEVTSQGESSTFTIRLVR